jgi:hypothetical protein
MQEILSGGTLPRQGGDDNGARGGYSAARWMLPLSLPAAPQSMC